MTWGKPTTFIAAMMLGGCSIHPVQQEATHVASKDIVRQIRCEMREAIQDKTIAMLRGYAETRPQSGAAALADRLEADRTLFMKLQPTDLDARELEFYLRYIKTGIGYDFTFDITEANGVSANVDPILLISKGTTSVGLAGSGDYRRQNLRHFQVSDTFEKLLQDKKLICDNRYHFENFAYPIAGRLGMHELISNFVDLNEDKTLIPLEKGSPRVFVDQMAFTTTWTGSISPQIVIAPVGNLVGVTPSGFGLSGSRADKHALILGLSQDPSSGVRSGPPAAPFVSGSSRGHPLAPTKITSEEQRALDAIAQQRIDTFYDRFGTLLR